MLRFAFETLEAALLFATAWAAYRGTRSDATGFSLVAAFGTLALAIDEFLNLHEAIGTAAYEDWGWPDPPLVNHWDDVIVIAIGVAGILVLAQFKDEILRLRTFAVVFGGGLAAFALAIAADGLLDPSDAVSWWTEEWLELIGALLMLAGFSWRARVLARGSRVAGAPAEAVSSDRL
jgi:hypothetical protein